MTCTNHLKQVGIGIHNFHDIEKTLPPICIFSQRPTVFMILYPFIEQQSLYEKAIYGNLLAKANSTGTAGTLCTGSWFASLIEEDKKAYASVGTYICPSRTRPGTFKLTGSIAGPIADYIVPAVNTHGNNDGNCRTHAWTVILDAQSRWTTTTRIELQNGPLHVPVLRFNSSVATPADPGGYAAHAANIMDWTYRDSMAYWQDGSSNQFVMLEKYVPDWAVSNDTAAANSWYGGYQNSAEDSDNYNLTRGIPVNARLFGRAPNDPNRTDSTIAAHSGAYCLETIGSFHPGMINILFGDGSIHSASVVTRPEIMWQLTHTNDGAVTSLP
jgi:prepilin-type processing-associated H-X9-DG protein